MAYYVKVQNPRSFRRDVLSTSKEVIGCLQAIRSVLVTRQKKKEKLEVLKEQLKELDLLVAKLDEILPEKELRQEAVEDLKKKKAKEEAAKRAISKVSDDKKSASKKDTSKKTTAKKKGSASKKTVVGPQSEVDQLNDVLANIEKKLASLK